MKKEAMFFLLPTLNEEKGLAKVLPALKKLYPDAMILVIDGRSSDKTVEIAKRYGCMVRLQAGRGKGNALSEALAIIPGEETVVLIDADGSYDPHDVREMLGMFTGNEIVIGNRFYLRGKPSFRSLNLAGNIMLSSFASALFLAKVGDLCSGLRVFRCETAKSLSLDSKGFTIETEMTLKAIKRGVKILETSCRYVKREGKTKLRPFSDGTAIFLRILKERIIW